MDSLPNIKIYSIPHHTQRYDTAGDYLELSYEWQVLISKLPNWKMQFILTMHELIEMGLTKHNGVSWKDIDDFDMSHPELDDPGACPKAPYHKEHMAAETIEKQLALLFGIDWKEYNAVLDALEYRKGA